MREDRVLKLAELLGMAPEELRGVQNPRAFPGKPFGYPPKHHGIDFDDPRPWVWIEDENLHKTNLDELERRDLADHYLECNTSLRPFDLLRIRALLEARFGLTGEG
jgi:hypothetical protein